MPNRNHSAFHCFFGLASLLLAFWGLSSGAWAHHGWRSYDAPLDMEFTITKTHWGGAHDRLTAIDSDGQQWDILLAPPVRNRRYGFDEDTVKVGQIVHMRGERHPERPEGKIHQIWLGDELIYEYFYGANYNSYDRLGMKTPRQPPE